MENNFDTPRTIKDSYSAKSATLITLESLKNVLKDKYNADQQIVLVTSYGFIKCDIDLDDSSEDIFLPTDEKDKYTFNIKSLTSLRNSFINSLETDNPNIKMRDDGAFLYLKNVTIYSNGMSASIAHPCTTFDNFIIFVDQILGFSLIPRTADE